MAAISPPPPRRTPGPVVFLVGLFFAVLGGAMLFAASKLYLKQREFLTHSERATGTVVAFAESIVTNSRNSDERSTFYAPVFTFTDLAGVTHRVTSKTSNGNKPGYRVNQTVPVLYNRDQPDDAELDTFFASWGGVTILGGMAAMFFAFGGAFAVNGLMTMLRGGGRQGPPGTGGSGDMPRDPAILAGP